MKHSSVCVYCTKEMDKVENSQNGKSVEHLIPNIATTIKRSNEFGDFHVCRKCNSDKSKLKACSDAGMVDHVGKPVQTNLLYKTLDRYLSSSI